MLFSLGRFHFIWNLRHRCLTILLALLIFALPIFEGQAMPSRALSGTQFTRPDGQRKAFRGLDVETLHIVPATTDGSNDSGECGLKVR